MRVAIYARISTNDGTQDIENQLAELRSFCVRQGWPIHAEYIDRMSGSRADRPQFAAMFEDASKRKFDLVLFWALDRLTREGTLATLNYLQRLDGYGVGYRSYQESYLDSVGPFKDVVIALMSTMAKQERLRISERTKCALARKRSEGVILGRPRVAVKPWELRQMKDRGMSIRAIAAEMKLSYGTVSRGLSA